MAGSLFTIILFPLSRTKSRCYAYCGPKDQNSENIARVKYKTTVLRPSSRGRGETGGRAYGGGFWNPGTAQVPLSSALLSIVVCARLKVLCRGFHGN